MSPKPQNLPFAFMSMDGAVLLPKRGPHSQRPTGPAECNVIGREHKDILFTSLNRFSSIFLERFGCLCFILTVVSHGYRKYFCSQH